jgi:methylated-DNA-[protein]-cysteine S-methyltransferase
MKNFSEKVYSVVKKIPKGEIMTYKEVAKQAGRPLAFRAVGNILNKNHDRDIPCHRVIRSDGKLGGYNQGASLKEKILKKEGALDNNGKLK